MALYLRFYGNSEDGDAFFNSIRTLFLSFNTLMDRPLDEGVKVKVSQRAVWMFLLTDRDLQKLGEGLPFTKFFKQQLFPMLHLNGCSSTAVFYVVLMKLMKGLAN